MYIFHHIRIQILLITFLYYLDNIVFFYLYYLDSIVWNEPIFYLYYLDSIAGFGLICYLYYRSSIVFEFFRSARNKNGDDACEKLRLAKMKAYFFISIPISWHPLLSWGI